MKKFTIGFGFGIFSVFFTAAVFTAHLLIVAEPGFRVTNHTKALTKEQRFEVVSALIKLSEISNFVGLERYAALFGGSAGMVGVDAGMSFADTRFSLNRAMILTKKYADQTGDFNPYFEASFTTALVYFEQGQHQDAEKIVAEAMAVAKKHSPDSYWLGNLSGLQKRL